MKELMERLETVWEGLADRERKMAIGILAFLFLWFTWDNVLSSKLSASFRLHKELVAVEKDYFDAAAAHRNVALFKAKKDTLIAELEQKLSEQATFNQWIRATGQVDELLEGLKNEARKSPLKLDALDIKPESPLTVSLPSKGDKGGGETVTYKRNNVQIHCKGSYRTSVEYLEKVFGLHRVMSINSLEMNKVIVPVRERADEGKGAKQAKPAIAEPGESLIETRLELEVFYK
jgi:hypothetical protein